MKNKIITQTTNIKKKLFSNKKRITLSTLTFLLIGGIILFGANYFAKGATYGWLQSTWSGGADTNAVADHTNNQSNWTKYFSKDDNVDTSNDELTLSSGSETVEDTTTGDFDAMAQSGEYCININTTGDQATATNRCYDAAPYSCGNFEVKDIDDAQANLADAKNECQLLGTGWALPSKNQLLCICQNKVNLGNNYAGFYWSSTPYKTGAYYVSFNNCSSLNSSYGASHIYGVRCIRSY